MDKLDEFIGEIIDAKQLPGINDEVRAALIEDMSKQLLDQIDRALVEELTDEQLDAFNDRMEQPDVDDNTAEQFLIDSGVDIQAVTARTMLHFRDLYLRPPVGPTEG